MPAAIEIVATEISKFEPCYWLEERILQSKESRGLRRWQQIGVMRDQWPAWYRIDLGPASSFKADEFVIPGGLMRNDKRFEILHSVEELMGMAEWLRNQPSLAAQIEPRNLIEGYNQVTEKKRDNRRKNRRN